MTGVPRIFARSLLAAFLTAGLTAQATELAPRRVPAAARAQVPQAAARIDVLVINGSTGPGGIGAGLENLPQLREMPFSVYTRLNLVSRTTLPLGAAPATVSIPNGNSAVITSTGRAANGRYQVNVQLTLSGRSHAVSFAAAPGDPFFTAQTTGADSALILGFIVR